MNAPYAARPGLDPWVVGIVAGSVSRIVMGTEGRQPNNLSSIESDDLTPSWQHSKNRGIRTAAITLSSVPEHGDARSDARWLGYLENAVRYCVIDLDAITYIAQLAGYAIDYDDGRWVGLATNIGDPNRSRRGR